MKRAEYLLALITISAVAIYAVFNYLTKSSNSSKLQTTKELKTKEQVYYNNEQDVVAYIQNVIINGSSKLKVSKEIMEGGYIPKDKAKDVACYVYELSGKKCTKKYSKDASLYFSSSCAGCHGIDGKGINGTYPDLTKSKLLGIKEN